MLVFHIISLLEALFEICLDFSSGCKPNFVFFFLRHPISCWIATATLKHRFLLSGVAMKHFYHGPSVVMYEFAWCWCFMIYVRVRFTETETLGGLFLSLIMCVGVGCVHSSRGEAMCALVILYFLDAILHVNKIQPLLKKQVAHKIIHFFPRS